MEWSNEDVLKFLEIYQREPCVWNPMDEKHKNRNANTDAWKRMLEKLHFNCTIYELKKKKDSLMASFRMLLKRKKQSIKSGEVYKPNWFAYSFMESFLAPVYHCSVTIKTEDATEQDVIPFLEANDDTQRTVEGMDDEEETGENNKESHDILTQQSQKSDPLSVISTRKNMGKKGINVNNREEKRLNEAYNLLKVVAGKKKHEEDECDAYTKLLAKKLRKFSELEREIVMHEIDNIVFERRMVSISSDNIPNTSRTSSSTSQSLPSPTLTFTNPFSPNFK